MTDKTHAPLDVDINGNGPLDEGDPTYDRTVCWCGDVNCRKIGPLLSVVAAAVESAMPALEEYERTHPTLRRSDTQ